MVTLSYSSNFFQYESLLIIECGLICQKLNAVSKIILHILKIKVNENNN